MKKLFVFVALAFTVLLISSCYKEDDNIDNSPNISHLQHLPLKIGNYWIYEHYQIDTLGNESKMKSADSVIITRDTLINNLTYSVFEGIHTYPGQHYKKIYDILRDSSGYLVNEKGQIKFSEDNFTDTLEKHNYVISDSIYATIYFKMEKHDQPVTVPAGTFDNVLNYKGNITFFGNNNPFTRIENTFYVKNIGKILDTYFYVSKAKQYKYERRLVRYNVTN